MFEKVKTGFRYRLNKSHEAYSVDPRKQVKHRAILFGGLAGILMAVLASAGIYMGTYGDRAAPATYLSGIDVSGKTRTEIKQLSHDLLDKIELKITNADSVVVARAADIGLTLDDEKTANQTVEISHEQNIFLRFNPFVKKTADLQVEHNILAFQEFLNKGFADVTVAPIDATIAYNPTSMQFDVVAGTPGRIVDAKKLQPVVEDVLKNVRSEIVKVDLSDAESAVSEDTAAAARDYMNHRIDLRLNLNHNGQLLYFIDPPDIADWADITPNPLSGQIDIEFDKAKIQQFLTNKVAPSLASAPVDEKILVDKTGKELMVAQHGRKGRQPRDMTHLVDQVYNATVEGVNMNQELDLIEADFKTTRIEVDDTNWIEVNLSSQTAMLWNGAQLIRTFVVSTGVAKWPTVTGEFRVWYKTPSQTMTGGSRADGSYYSLDNVKWVSYFYQDYAFHGKWWNNVYGRPSSHGCVGMTNDDAKIVYDFAPVGTRVVVHY
jgi:lipoprotein-anchoring transpeptidase ErfK/SrfK